jgi:hypothetical protein
MIPDKKSATAAALFMISALAILIQAQENEIVKLPAPQMTGGRPLMDCLKTRSTGPIRGSAPRPRRSTGRISTFTSAWPTDCSSISPRTMP